MKENLAMQICMDLKLTASEPPRADNKHPSFGDPRLASAPDVMDEHLTAVARHILGLEPLGQNHAMVGCHGLTLAS